MRFKKGDTVVCVDSRKFSLIKEGLEYTVADVCGDQLEVFGIRWIYPEELFRKAEPTLEQEIERCESTKGVLDYRIAQHQEEQKSLEKRIQELQQAIKERDKPKGRIKVGDSVPFKSFLICATGDVKPHTRNSWSSANVAMGNLFYDKESAERAVHDRKQRVLRGEDV